MSPRGELEVTSVRPGSEGFYHVIKQAPPAGFFYVITQCGAHRRRVNTSGWSREMIISKDRARRRALSWPLVLLALPAFVAIWSGWVDLGRLTGFGVVHPLPGIADRVRLDTAITLPIGLETYAAFALFVWLAADVPAGARSFAKWSAIGSLALGAFGQVVYHLMIAAGMRRAPWPIVIVVACLPVAVLGMGAALRHLVTAPEQTLQENSAPERSGEAEQEMERVLREREQALAEAERAFQERIDRELELLREQAEREERERREKSPNGRPRGEPDPRQETAVAEILDGAGRETVLEKCGISGATYGRLAKVWRTLRSNVHAEIDPAAEKVHPKLIDIMRERARAEATR